jgi:dTDP-4-dehydrorhamnose reductase
VRLLVTGALGMLGTDVVALADARGIAVIGVDVADGDLTDAGQAELLVEASRPDVIINCAAWTDVDAAEAAEDKATAVNGLAVENLARAAARQATRLIQVSTDYVFRGDATGVPYTEDAEPDPANAYGRSKLAGEKAALAAGGVVVRTAWLYGAHGTNFVATMQRLERERDTVDVVDDQVGQPTWTHDLADRLLDLAQLPNARGVFHGTATGQTSWHGLARAVFRLIGADPERVRPTSSAAFPRPATRPAWSVLGQARWASIGLAPLPEWRDQLNRFLG